MRNLKAGKREIRFNKAVRSQNALTSDELKGFILVCEKEGMEKITRDTRSIYYGQPENKNKDWKSRKTWIKKYRPDLLASK